MGDWQCPGCKSVNFCTSSFFECLSNLFPAQRVKCMACDLEKPKVTQQNQQN